MNREGCVMGFFEDYPPKIVFSWYNQSSAKENDTLIIYGETFSNSTSNVLLDLSNTTITFLVGYDFILKGWFRHQGRKKAMRNNLKIELAKFLMKKWLILLQHEVVTLRLTT